MTFINWDQTALLELHIIPFFKLLIEIFQQ